jgi:hypothetical protein
MLPPSSNASTTSSITLHDTLIPLQSPLSYLTDSSRTLLPHLLSTSSLPTGPGTISGIDTFHSPVDDTTISPSLHIASTRRRTPLPNLIKGDIHLNKSLNVFRFFISEYKWIAPYYI